MGSQRSPGLLQPFFQTMARAITFNPIIFPPNEQRGLRVGGTLQLQPTSALGFAGHFGITTGSLSRRCQSLSVAPSSSASSPAHPPVVFSFPAVFSNCQPVALDIHDSVVLGHVQQFCFGVILIDLHRRNVAERGSEPFPRRLLSLARQTPRSPSTDLVETNDQDIPHGFMSYLKDM